jgi:transcription elongation factor GreA-like protein
MSDRQMTDEEFEQIERDYQEMIRKELTNIEIAEMQLDFAKQIKPTSDFYQVTYIAENGIRTCDFTEELEPALKRMEKEKGRVILFMKWKKEF